MVSLFFSRRYWWTTLLVLVALGILVRLGIWQLDRLAQRVAFNTRVTAQLDAPPLTLTPETLDADLTKLEYRAVNVVGAYDHANQVALRNQVWMENNLGAHLLTPLIISGTRQAVIVDRGWIPQNDAAAENWKKFDEPGIVSVSGILRASQAAPDFGGVPDPPGSLKVWNLANLTRIAEQIPYPILPVYVQQAPEPARLVKGTLTHEQTTLPYRAQPELDLSEGDHFSYAMQWFLFALVLGGGYPFFIRNQEQKRKLIEQTQA